MPGYDYSQPGAYFVTICVQSGECLLGEVVNGTVVLIDFGRLTDGYWAEVLRRFPSIAIDAVVTMPNHIHVIIVIIVIRRGEVSSPLVADVGTGREEETPGRETRPLYGDAPRLGQIVAYYKYQTTKTMNAMRDTRGQRFWQRNYWEHVVRNEAEMNRIRQYIQDNPAKWAEDKLHPLAPTSPFK